MSFTFPLWPLLTIFTSCPLREVEKYPKSGRRGYGGVFPAIVLISGLTGYDQFAVMAFSILLSTIIVNLIIWVLYLFHLGLLELLLSFLPFTFIKNNFSGIIKVIQPIVAWFHILILVTIQSVIWDVAQEELVNSLSVQLNSRMYMLSIITSIFLPLSFFTGLLVWANSCKIKQLLSRYQFPAIGWDMRDKDPFVGYGIRSSFRRPIASHIRFGNLSDR